MRTIINEAKIIAEQEKITKLTSYTSEPYPLNSLSDREFEILTYFLYQNMISERNLVFDKVTLMSGIGERGRDVILSLKGKDVGIIQCKKYKSNLDKTIVAKEIIKLVLFEIVEGNIIPEKQILNYYLAITTGLSNTAKNIIRNHPTELIDNLDFEKWTNEVIKEYSSLKHLVFKDIQTQLISLLKRLELNEVTPQDLNKLLDASSDVANYFFKIQQVTDNKLLEKIIQKYLDPILKSVSQKEGEKTYIDIVDFKKQFQKYLETSVENYSYARTLVFGSQQKKLEDFYMPLTLSCIKDEKRIEIKINEYPKSLIPKFKKVLISDTGGMGKSTVMKWLFLNAVKQNQGIPIFIELRSLKNNHLILDEIISQLEAIDTIYEKTFIQKIIAGGNFIFFFDGFDEIGIEHREQVITDLQNFISKTGNNLFILTSRPESALNSFADFQEFKINPLKKEEAFDLILKLGNSNDKSKRLVSKIQEQNLRNIDEFLTNPLLVSLLFKKFEHREILPFDKRGFYLGVFDALFEGHDIAKDGVYIRDKKSKLNPDKFHQLLRALGFITLKTFEIEYSKSQLIQLLKDSLKQCPGIEIDVLLFMEDVVSIVPLFLKDADIYRWQHKSLQEYFAAEFICQDSKIEEEKILNIMFQSENFEKIRNVLIMCYEFDYKTFRNTILYPFSKGFIELCNNTFIEIKKNTNIPISEIYIRQSMDYLQGVNTCYLINIPLFIENSDSLEVNSLFQNKEYDYVGSHDFFCSSDNYHWIHLFKSKKNTKNNIEAKKHSNVVSFFYSVENPIFIMKKFITPVFDYKKEIISYFQREINEKRFKIKPQLFYDETLHFIEPLNDNISSILNNEKYFSKITDFLNYSHLNYNECVRLVAAVEEDKNNESENGLASGF